MKQPLPRFRLKGCGRCGGDMALDYTFGRNSTIINNFYKCILCSHIEEVNPVVPVVSRTYKRNGITQLKHGGRHFIYSR